MLAKQTALKDCTVFLKSVAIIGWRVEGGGWREAFVDTNLISSFRVWVWGLPRSRDFEYPNLLFISLNYTSHYYSLKTNITYQNISNYPVVLPIICKEKNIPCT